MTEGPPAAGGPHISDALDPIGALLRARVLDPPDRPGIAAQVDRFDVLRLLGGGGMGVILLVRERGTSRPFALKTLKPALAHDPYSVRLFLREARHVQQMDHPNILPVLEVSDRLEGPYFVMPYVERGSLAHILKPGRTFDCGLALSIAQQVAEALAYAHEHGVIHRDLKPANVLVDGEGHAYVADFGLVRALYGDSTVDVRKARPVGTGPYMSPGVAAGQTEDTRCDIYSLGAVMYEMFTGRPPYEGATTAEVVKKILAGPPPAIRKFYPSAPRGLVAVAEGAMARQLRDRYANMRDLAADIRRIEEGRDVRGPHGAREFATAPAGHRRFSLLVFIVVLIAFPVAWVFLRPSRTAKAPIRALETGPPGSETLGEKDRLERPLGGDGDTPAKTSYMETIARSGGDVPVLPPAGSAGTTEEAGQPEETTGVTAEVPRQGYDEGAALEEDFSVATASSGYDLRKRYGTQTLESARYISRGLTLYHEGRFEEAKAELQQAADREPNCEFALYWLAETETDLGDVDAALAAYRKVIALADGASDIVYPSNVAIDAAINAGILCGHLGRYAESGDLLARALLLDPKDQHGYAWKARRNLALTQYEKGDYSGAALNAAMGRKANPDKVEGKMVRDFTELARRTSEITTRILPILAKPDPRRDRKAVAATELPPLDCPEPVGLLLSDPCGEWLVAIPKGAADHYCVVPLQDGRPGLLASHPVDGRLVGAALGGRLLFLSLGRSPGEPARLVAISPMTGTPASEVPLPFGAPQHFAVAPGRSRLFFCDAGKVVKQYDWSKGPVEVTPLKGDFVAITPDERAVFSLLRPEDKSSPGDNIIIGPRGTIQAIRLGPYEPLHATLQKGFISAGGVLLASMRLEVASNAKVLTMSSDGRWVAPTGGGGWRESGQRGGYGTAFFDAEDVGRMGGFYACEAYPRAVAINPVNWQVASVSTKAVHLYPPQGGESQAFGAAEEDGDFTQACAFTGDGQLLAVGTENGRLRFFSTPLLPDEEDRARRWWRDLAEPGLLKLELPEGAELPWLATFTPHGDRPAVVALLQKGLLKGTDCRLPLSIRIPRYQRYEAFAGRASVLLTKTRLPAAVVAHAITEEAGPLPQSAVTSVYVGLAQVRANALEEGVLNLTKAVRADLGRSRITLVALGALSDSLLKQERPIEALHCLAAAVQIDRYDQSILERLEKLLTELEMPDELGQVRALRREVSGIDEAASDRPDAARDNASTTTEDEAARPRDELPSHSKLVRARAGTVSATLAGAPEARDTPPSQHATAQVPGRPARLELDLGEEVTMQLVRIPAGEFVMGSPSNEDYRENDERQHRVRITRQFYMGVTEVTQAQYQAVMGTNPAEFKEATRPVEQVTWYDAQDFCRTLSQRVGMTVRLPTEAEWEYACRAGSPGAFYWGERMENGFAWCETTSGGRTHDVGLTQPNAFGLHDMSGNILEWCQDWYARDYYSVSPGADPAGPPSGNERVRRGGAWCSGARACRSGDRNYGRPADTSDYCGFRIVTDSPSSPWQAAGGAAAARNSPPQRLAVSLACTPRVLKIGATFTLTAGVVALDPGEVAKVEFYRDNNDNGRLEPFVQDSHLGEDAYGNDGWSLTLPVYPQFGTGPERFFAVAVDRQGNRSMPAWVTVTVQN